MSSIDRDIILVTGAAGLIGSCALKVLHENGMNIAGLYKTSPLGNFQWPVVIGDLSENSLDSIVGRNRTFTTIVHCAAYLPLNSDELGKASLINRKIDNNIIQDVSGKKIKLIYLSGTSVYGFSDEICTEETIPNPEGEYVQEKYETENSIKNEVDDHTILRVSAPYGPGQRSRTVFRIFIENALQHKPLLYYGSGVREQDFTYAGDVARAILKCVQHPEINGLFNIASGETITMKDLAHLVVRSVEGSKSEVRAAGLPDIQESYKARFSIEKAEKILKWTPEVSLEQGIQKWLTYLADENRNIK